MLKYILNYIFRAGDCDMIYWIVGFNLTFDVHKKPDTFTLLNHYTVIMALAFRIIVNKKKAVTYCQQALFIVKVFIKCSLHCLLNIRYAFLLCHNLRLHKPKTPGIGKTVLSASCARFKSHIWKSRPSPTLRPRNICICPCLSRSTQISRLCPFSSRWQSE